ncbi:MAG: DUF4276 family protein [Candidatus Wallbacteria bacterium]|nr:DUF4276 family protein [Candidatus Wallbacteria bacterium]
MKAGFIVECGPEGAEIKVIPHLARMIFPKAEIIEPIPGDKKPILKKDCGKWVTLLLGQGCDKVFIIWDLLPDWEEYEGKGCRHDDRKQIFDSLEKVGIKFDDPRICLICIEKMLEAWLLADERVLSKFLSTDEHPVSVPRVKKPEREKDPKARLDSVFSQFGIAVKGYTDVEHAIKIARSLENLKRLEKLKTFKRFRDKLIGG